MRPSPAPVERRHAGVACGATPFPAAVGRGMKGVVLRLVLVASLAVVTAARADAPSEGLVTGDTPAGPVAPAPSAPEANDPAFSIGGDTITLEVTHTFPRASARERVGFLINYWNKRFGVKAEWHGDRVFLTGRVFAMEIRARFDVSDTSVTGIAADPGWFWRGKAQAYVTKKLKKYLHPDYADP